MKKHKRKPDEIPPVSHEDFMLHTQQDIDNFNAIKESMRIIHNDLNEIKSALAPLSEAYNGVLFGKKLMMGLGGIVLAIVAVGGGIMWLINAAVNKQ